MMTLARQAGKVGQRIEREVYLARRSTILVALHLVAKIVAEMLRLDHLQERKIRVNTRRDDRREVLIARRCRDSDRLAILDENLRDGNLRLNLDAEFARCVSNGIGDRPRSAASEA